MEINGSVMCKSESDSEVFGLDSDLDSELESKNPDSDSGKKGGFRFESGFENSVSTNTDSPCCLLGLSMTSWIRIRIRIQSSWIRIWIQEKRRGFGFSRIRIPGVWIRTRIRDA